VHVHPDAPFGPEPLGKAEMVGVPVRQHDTSHRVQAAAEEGQLAKELSPMARKPSVDHGDAVVTDDEIGSDDVVADAVEGWCDLHGLSPMNQDGMMATIRSHQG
jgi:hypothetical protein